MTCLWIDQRSPTSLAYSKVRMKKKLTIRTRAYFWQKFFLNFREFYWFSLLNFLEKVFLEIQEFFLQIIAKIQDNIFSKIGSDSNLPKNGFFVLTKLKNRIRKRLVNWQRNKVNQMIALVINWMFEYVQSTQNIIYCLLNDMYVKRRVVSIDVYMKRIKNAISNQKIWKNVMLSWLYDLKLIWSAFTISPVCRATFLQLMGRPQFAWRVPRSAANANHAVFSKWSQLLINKNCKSQNNSFAMNLSSSVMITGC